MSLKEAALGYANRGWPVFPCRADKTPYTKNGVLDATTDPEKVAAMWDENPMANIGFAVGRAGMATLDFDPGSDIKELEANVGPIPDTQLRVRTPRGGSHDYLSLGVGEIVAPSASKLAPHIDVRSFNSYTLLPPSRTADGEYTWISEGKPAYRTDELLRACNSAREKSEGHNTWIIEKDIPENTALAIAWLKDEARIAVEGQGGDSEAYATAAHLKSYGISEALAFDLMWEHWNPRCSPPWSSDDASHLQTKVQNGYAYNTSPPGNLTPAYRVALSRALFTPIVTEIDGGGHSWTSGRYRFVDAEGIENIKPPKWLIADFIPEDSYNIIFGESQSFKTFIALDIALSICAGIGMGDTAMWPDVRECGDILFLAGEGRSSIPKRKKAWEQMHFAGVRIDGLVLADPVPLVSEDRAAFFEGALSRNPDGYKLVVLDTVGRAMQGLNENAQEHASSFTGLVQEMQRELGCSVLALHHTGHGAKDRARGSSVFGAEADMMVRLDRKGTENLVEMTMTKQKDAALWEKSRWISLRDVPEYDTLVATKSDHKPPNKPKRDEKEDGVTDVVEREMMILLEENRIREWSARALAIAISATGRVNLTDGAIVKTHLAKIRSDNTRRGWRCFHSTAPTQHWRYQD